MDEDVSNDDDGDSTIVPTVESGDATSSVYMDTPRPNQKHGKRKIDRSFNETVKRSCFTSSDDPGMLRVDNATDETVSTPSVLQNATNLRNLVHAPARKPITKNASRAQAGNLHAKAVPLPQVSNLHKKIAPSVLLSSKLMKSVHISRFSNDTTCDDILNHLRFIDSTSNIVNEIQCKRLTRGGRPISSYKFITFKLTFPRQYFERIVNPSIWPSSIKA
ncbi:uncharacterized protein LOC129572175, partial [Sitodiplosis mosellana]|uniref:uncharacterized protein LOC129572175 n=1 Tax=Sitodiplosis mosellana TaxID=263140 RepID=UPI0024448C2B